MILITAPVVTEGSPMGRKHPETRYHSWGIASEIFEQVPP